MKYQSDFIVHIYSIKRKEGERPLNFTLLLQLVSFNLVLLFVLDLKNIYLICQLSEQCGGLLSGNIHLISNILCSKNCLRIFLKNLHDIFLYCNICLCGLRPLCLSLFILSIKLVNCRLCILLDIGVIDINCLKKVLSPFL